VLILFGGADEYFHKNQSMMGCFIIDINSNIQINHSDTIKIKKLIKIYLLIPEIISF